MSNISFVPDWYEIWSVSEAEAQLKNFKFEGPGWYMVGNDSLLVLDSDIQVLFGPPLYTFCVYNNRDARRMFNNIASAPVLSQQI